MAVVNYFMAVVFRFALKVQCFFSGLVKFEGGDKFFIGFTEGCDA